MTILIMCATHVVFFFNAPATTEIYTLSLQRRSSDLSPGSEHDYEHDRRQGGAQGDSARGSDAVKQRLGQGGSRQDTVSRSEEHTSELQSHVNLVCRLLLEKKKHQESFGGPRFPDSFG